MIRRDLALQGTLAFGLIVAIVGGNFVLHRWMLGNSTSREANAGTAPTIQPIDDLDEFAPTTRPIAQTVDPVVQREQLRRLISGKLPHDSEEVRDAWLEELCDVSLREAEGILDLRGEFERLKQVDEQQQFDDQAWGRIIGGIGITR